MASWAEAGPQESRQARKQGKGQIPHDSRPDLAINTPDIYIYYIYIINIYNLYIYIYKPKRLQK